MFQRVKKIQQAAVLFALTGCVSTAQSAGLPDVSAPTGVAADSSDYVGMIKAYSLDVVIVIGFLLAVGAFVVVAKNAITVYSDIQSGKSQWTDLGVHGLVGTGLIVFVVFLMTQMSDVLA